MDITSVLSLPALRQVYELPVPETRALKKAYLLGLCEQQYSSFAPNANPDLLWASPHITTSDKMSLPDAAVVLKRVLLGPDTDVAITCLMRYPPTANFALLHRFDLGGGGGEVSRTLLPLDGKSTVYVVRMNCWKLVCFRSETHSATTAAPWTLLFWPRHLPSPVESVYSGQVPLDMVATSIQWSDILNSLKPVHELMYQTQYPDWMKLFHHTAMSTADELDAFQKNPSVITPVGVGHILAACRVEGIGVSGKTSCLGLLSISLYDDVKVRARAVLSGKHQVKCSALSLSQRISPMYSFVDHFLIELGGIALGGARDLSSLSDVSLWLQSLAKLHPSKLKTEAEIVHALLSCTLVSPWMVRPSNTPASSSSLSVQIPHIPASQPSQSSPLVQAEAMSSGNNNNRERQGRPRERVLFGGPPPRSPGNGNRSPSPHARSPSPTHTSDEIFAFVKQANLDQLRVRVVELTHQNRIHKQEIEREKARRHQLEALLNDKSV